MAIQEQHAYLVQRQEELAAQLRLLLDSTDEGFYGLDRDGRCTFINKAAAEMTGFQPRELLGEIVHELNHHTHANGDAYPIEECQIYAAIETGKGVTVGDEVFWKKDGSSFPVEYSSYPVLEHGVVSGAVVVFKDVTERVAMESDLRASEDLFRNAFDASRTGMALIAPDNTYLKVNDSLCEMVGYTREELLATDWISLTHPDDVEFQVDLAQRLLAGSVQPYELTKRYMHKNGSVVWVELNDAVVRDATGKALYFVCQIQDVTKRNATQAALEESQKLLEGIIESSPAVIYIKKKSDRTYIMISRNWVQALGLDQKDVIGKTDFEIFPAAQARAFTEHDDVVFRTELPAEDEDTAVHPDGTAHIYRSLKFPLFDHDGVCYALCGVSEDITEKKLAEEARGQLEGQLKQAQKMEAVGELAGGIAHDFNNMLAVILNYSAFLAEDLGIDDPRRVDVQEIVKAGEKAAVLVHQLLAFSRQEVIEPKVLNLNDVVADLKELLRSSIGEEINLVIHDGLGLPAILADAGQLERVLLNLAVNAREAMPRGGTLSITTSSEVILEGDRAGLAAGRYVRLSFTDTGHGMAPETMDRIFEPFFSTKVRGEGGLGLSTVYGIVKQASGGIYVDSAPGHGTSFSVFLPVTDHDPSDLTDRTVTKIEESRPGTILVVEDETGVRALVSRILSKQGYRVTAFPNGSEALAYCELNAEDVDLLLTDVVMPEMSGKALADGVLALGPDIKTIFMSGYTDEIIAERGVLSEGEHLIMKPFKADELLLKVRSVMAGDTT